MLVPAACPNPVFAAARAANNIIFRIPTPVFGAGLIENLDDSTLLNNQAAISTTTLALPEHSNRNGNDAPSAALAESAEQVAAHLFR